MDATVLEADLNIVGAAPSTVRRVVGRLADSAPFFGGGRLTMADGSGCSTGFYVNSATRGTVMVFAGHCGLNNGETVKNGNLSHVVGLIEGRSLPDPDLAVLDGQSYAARSFSNNDDTTSKPVTGATSPQTGSLYCQYGSFSRRICSTYSSVNAQFCDVDGCTNGLAFTSRDCDLGTLVRPGDSGGGVFREVTSTTIGARGIVVAGGQLGPSQCVRYDHRWVTVADFYDATIQVQ